MAAQLVIVYSGHSLFAQGIASRLREYPDEVVVEVFDPRKPRALQRVIEASPRAVILETEGTVANGMEVVCALLRALPTLKVFYVDPQRAQIQVVTSQQRQAVDVQGLVAMIKEEA